MTFDQTVELYASVLRQLLPAGGYDTSPKGVVAKDVYAHAKVLAQADVDAKRILAALEGIPEELLSEYETALGLPLKCSVNTTKTIEERLQIIKWVQETKNVLNRTYLEQVLAMFGVELIDLVRFTPMQCTAPCTSPVNTESLRYKVKLILKAPVQADMACIIENYLPAYVRYDIVEEQP
ncbi:putative phage tail protein [Acinetobacter pittii]|uniref:putative phage tail protein n=1 Tax=Acinetobacter pittii TaxID=48296 RepID=UPI0005EACB7D|nr:putative phage tail protein [Acinetobacter pittii]